VSLFGNDGFAGTTGSSFNNVGNSCAIRLLMKRTKNCKGGLKLDYEILKSLKFTSQFNGEYYTWKNYNFEELEIFGCSRSLRCISIQPYQC
jgi:hypothetical protein